jgi:hypothetical protein
MQNEGELILNQGSSLSYKHWNIFFKDIYKVTIDIFDRETNQKIDLKDLEQLQGNSQIINNGQPLNRRNSTNTVEQQNQALSDLHERYTKLYFVLKIYYQINDVDDAFSFIRDGDYIVFDHKAKKTKNKFQKQGPDYGLGAASGLSGFKVGRKEIIAKDFKVMKRVFTAIQNH